MATAWGNLPVLNSVLSPEFYNVLGGSPDEVHSPAADIWGTANLIHYYPFMVAGSFTIQRFWIAQSAQGAASVGRVGIYDSSSNKLTEGNGTIDLTTAGANVIRLVSPTAPYILSASTLYYLAITVNTAAAWTGYSTGAAAGAGGDWFDMLGCKEQAAGGGTLPSTATMADFATDQVIYACGITSSTTIPISG